MRLVKNSIIVLFLIACCIISLVTAQAQTPVECGTVLESEFTDDYQEHFYGIELGHGDKFNVRIASLERPELLRFAIVFYDPDGNLWIDTGANALNDPYIESPLLNRRGDFVIKITNSNIWYGEVDRTSARAGIGRYTIFIGCVMRDGTVITPGTTPTPTPTNTPTMPTLSGFGFPGLTPVDFTQGVTTSLDLSSPNQGSISDSFVGIFGFTFTGNAGDVFEMSFERLSGNLNLGLAVLSEQNEIAFQASLVTSSTLSTRFTLPSTGEYTIGVFRIELLPPAAPEATTFQITGAINP